MPDPFIVTGPGRCGTMSAAAALRSLPGVICGHETVRPMWSDELQPETEHLIAEMLEDGVRGEATHLLWPQIPHIFDRIPSLSVVWLERPDAEVVDSWIHNAGGVTSFRPVDRGRNPDNPTYKSYPVYPNEWDVKKCWHEWVDECRRRFADLACRKIVFPVRELSSTSSLSSLASDLGLVVPDVHIWPTQPLNTRGEIVVINNIGGCCCSFCGGECGS